MDPVTSHRVEAVLALLDTFDPWERAVIRRALRPVPPLKLYDPTEASERDACVLTGCVPAPIEWTPDLEAEAVAQGAVEPSVAAAVRGGGARVVPGLHSLTEYTLDTETGELFRDDEPIPFALAPDDDQDEDEEDTTIYVEAEREAAALAFTLLGQDDSE